jgi:hypothetical protein
MSGNWTEDKIAAHRKLVEEHTEALKVALKADQLVVIAVFYDGNDRHVFDAADCELPPEELYAKMLAFHTADAKKPTVN